MLKRLLARHVPRAIWDHPTRGFVLPLDRWIAGPLRDRVRKVVCEEGPAGLRVEAKRVVWSRFERNPSRMATRVWALFVLDEWCRRHL